VKTKLSDLYISFFKISLFTFGGGLAAIPILEREVVQKRNWVSEQEMLDFYAVSQMTPGVILVNVSTFIGHKERGTIGAIVSTLGVVSPSLIIISIIAKLIFNFADIPIVQSAVKGIAAGICAIILSSLLKLAKKSIQNKLGILLCILSFLIAYFSSISVAWVSIGAILLGILIYGKGGKKQ